MSTEEYPITHPIQVCPEEHPIAPYLRMDRMPHIWCSGCGIGAVLKAFVSALEESKLDLRKVVVVSGIGCTGRVAGYVKLDSFHTTHGRAIPFATGLKLARPDLKVVVVSGDGDLLAIGGNHFIHAARRNAPLTIICVNNFNYGMTGGQVAPTTPVTAVTSTTPYGNYEAPFNMPHLAASCGAVYVARWAVLDIRRVSSSIQEAMAKEGFSLVEIIAPCPTLYARRNKLGDAVDELEFYRLNTVIQNGANTADVGIDFRKQIITGKFVDIERPSYIETMDRVLSARLGDKYRKYTVAA